jgi:hypothetical protein
MLALMFRALVVALAVLGGAFACSSAPSEPPLLATGGGGGAVGGGGSSSSSSGGTCTPPNAETPGGLAIDGGGVCGCVLPTTLITEQQVNQPAPAVTGGPITPGTYVLTAISEYTGTGGATGPTSKIEGEVLVVTASALGQPSYERAVIGALSDGGAGAPSVESGFYTVTLSDGGPSTTFTENATCGIGNIPVGYTSNGTDTITLSFGSEYYVHTRQ